MSVGENHPVRGGTLRCPACGSDPCRQPSQIPVIFSMGGFNPFSAVVLGRMVIATIAVLCALTVLVTVTANLLMNRKAELDKERDQFRYDQERELEFFRHLYSNQPDTFSGSIGSLPLNQIVFHAHSNGGHTMRVFLSGRFGRQQEIRKYAEQLRAENIEVVSAWHDIDLPSSDGFSGIGEGRLRWLALMEVQQLSASNTLVAFASLPVRYEPATAADQSEVLPSSLMSLVKACDRDVETGIALALGKRILLVGEPEHKYHCLPDVEEFPAWPECFARILQLRQTDAMTVRQAAKEAGVLSQQVLSWIKSGKLPAVKNSRRRWVIARNDLDRLKAGNARQRADKG